MKDVFIKYSPMYIAFSLIQIAREKYIDKNLIKEKLFNKLINLYGINQKDYEKCYEEIKYEIKESNIENEKEKEKESINIDIIDEPQEELNKNLTLGQSYL